VRASTSLGQAHQRQPIPRSLGGVGCRIAVAREIELRELIRTATHEVPDLVDRAVLITHRPELDQVLTRPARIARIEEHAVDKSEAVEQLVAHKGTVLTDRALFAQLVQTSGLRMPRKDEPKRSAKLVEGAGTARAGNALQCRWLRY